MALGIVIIVRKSKVRNIVRLRRLGWAATSIDVSNEQCMVSSDSYPGVSVGSKIKDKVSVLCTTKTIVKNSCRGGNTFPLDKVCEVPMGYWKTVKY